MESNQDNVNYEINEINNNKNYMRDDQAEIEQLEQIRRQQFSKPL